MCPTQQKKRYTVEPSLVPQTAIFMTHDLGRRAIGLVLRPEATDSDDDANNADLEDFHRRVSKKVRQVVACCDDDDHCFDCLFDDDRDDLSWLWL